MGHGSWIALRQATRQPGRKKRERPRFGVPIAAARSVRPPPGRWASVRYLPCQLGGRFSANARGPSMKSWLLDNVATDS